MGYAVRVNGRLPFSYGLGHGTGHSSGLAHGTGHSSGLAEALPTDPWGVRLAETLGTPLVTALSSRIAYGTTPPVAMNLSTTRQGAAFASGAFGGMAPSTLLLLAGGAALLLLVMSRRK